MTRATARRRAWIGLAAAPIAWLAHHQFGSMFNFAYCHVGDERAVLAAGLIAMVIVGLGAVLAWSGWRSDAARRDAPTRFVALLALMAAALFGLTIAVQIGAGLIVPACFN